MKRRKRYGADAEMADILDQATRRQFHLVAPEEMRGLRMEEIRQLHMARLHQQLSGQGGAPAKLPAAAECEIRRRINSGQVKFAGDMEEKFLGVMTRRSWQRHISRLRKTKATKRDR